MGRLKQGILGGFLGKVGGVVGSNWKGIATMRAMPLSVANPKTAKQVGNRTRFSLVTSLATMVGVDFLRTYWNRGAMQMSGFNAFCQANKDSYNSNGLFYPLVTVMSNGTITPPSMVSQEISAAAKAFHCTLQYPIEGNRLATDVINLVFVNNDGSYAMATPDIPSSQSDFAIDLPDELAQIATNVNVYLVSRRADGTLTSSTRLQNATVTT